MSPFPTRRDFLKETALSSTATPFRSSGRAHRPFTRVSAQPWHLRTLRWGQTNITEADPGRYDIGWWRKYWKQIHT